MTRLVRYRKSGFCFCFSFFNRRFDIDRWDASRQIWEIPQELEHFRLRGHPIFLIRCGTLVYSMQGNVDTTLRYQGSPGLASAMGEAWLSKDMCLNTNLL